MGEHSRREFMDHRDAGRGGEVATLMERILYEVKKVVVGQDHFLERVLVAVLAQGHLLVEGVPGLAKTLTVKTLATVFAPFLPFAAGKVAAMLSCDREQMRWQKAAEPLTDGTALGEVSILFSKIETVE